MAAAALGLAATAEGVLAQGVPLEARVLWSWGPEAGQFPDSTDVWSTPVVARILDTNLDGVVDARDDPSLVFVSGRSIDAYTGHGASCTGSGTTPTACLTGVLRVLNGRTGEEQFSLDRVSPTSAGFAGMSVAVGDVSSDGTVQIVAATGEGQVALIGSPSSPPEAPLQVLRTSDQPIPGNISFDFGWGGGLALADMDADGFPEIAYGATVFGTRNEAITRVWTGTSGIGGPGVGSALSTLARLAGGSGLLLLAGNTAYRADGSLLWHRISVPDGFDAVADLDGDGGPEVALVGGGSLHVLDGATGISRLPATALPGSGVGGGGPPTIADFDGDGRPEIGVAMATAFAVLKPDFANGRIDLLWQRASHDYSSSRTAATAFDFDGHGRADVVYADECFLWVFEGATGAVRLAVSHTSFTATEAPLVADVDGDGRAEIVMASTGADPLDYRCLNANGQPVMVNGVTWEPSSLPSRAYRGITVLGAAGQPWAAAPALWNQHTFHVTNVSDGSGPLYPGLSYGAIPREETPNWSVPGLNNFRQSVSLAPPDQTPPAIAPTLNPSPRGDGWNNIRPVLVTWAVTDPESGVVTSVGCEPTTLTTDTTGTVLTCSAINGAGLSASESVTVRIDATPPELTLPSDITAEAAGASGTRVDFAATATDAVDGGVAVTCWPAAGSTFPIGGTTVECSATDARGNTGAGCFTVSVRDTTPPVLALPGPVTFEATGPSGAVVTFSASARDVVDGSVAVRCAPVSGSTFALGTTLVYCSATDACGNTRVGSFAVAVVDTTPPSVTCPAPVSIDSAGASGAAVSFSVTASDTVSDVSTSCVPPSGSVFPIGISTVLCMGKDASSNSTGCSFTIRVAGPRRVMQSVFSDLVSLLATVRDKRDGDRLDEAIKHLGKAVEDRLWRDDSHPDEKQGERTFSQAKDAVQKLLELTNDKHSRVNDAMLRGLAGRILGAGRVTAQIALLDALVRGGDARRIDKARGELDKADAEIGKGDVDDALMHFSNAWKSALKA